MTYENPPLALISVTDKTGVVSFAKSLRELGFLVLSTGGTAKVLREHQIEVMDVSKYTDSPEILGRKGQDHYIQRSMVEFLWTVIIQPM